jgi:hypothetical protein
MKGVRKSKPCKGCGHGKTIHQLLRSPGRAAFKSPCRFPECKCSNYVEARRLGA